MPRWKIRRREARWACRDDGTNRVPPNSSAESGLLAIQVIQRLEQRKGPRVAGRTDFQNGDATTLFASVHEKLFTLPEDTLVYPAHDYNERRVSTIGQEKARNPRLGGGRDLQTFLGIMQALDLPYPKFIDYAVPGNRQCGVCPDGIPDSLQQYCESIKVSIQG